MQATGGGRLHLGNLEGAVTSVDQAAGVGRI